MRLNCDSSTATYTFILLAGIISLVLGALSWARTHSVFLPFQTWIPALTTLLAPLTLISLATIRVLFPANGRPNNYTTPLNILNHLHTVLITTLATLALSYLFPSQILTCHLESQWQSLFQHKDAQAIRTIQDRYQCCGLRSIRDRAWPFKDGTHEDNACELQLGYTRPCLGLWSGQQRSASWFVFAAAVGIFLLKIGLVQLSNRRTSWMNGQFLPNGRPQRIAGLEQEHNGDDAEQGNEGESRRTMLPHSRPGQENVWDVD
ncbi:hypothetical protein BDV18DRAFT_144447 [Aspergillus unguis]